MIARSKYGDIRMKKQSVKNKPLRIKTRVTWGLNPVSRVKTSKKIYSRKSHKNNLNRQIMTI